MSFFNETWSVKNRKMGKINIVKVVFFACYFHGAAWSFLFLVSRFILQFLEEEEASV